MVSETDVRNTLAMATAYGKRLNKSTTVRIQADELTVTDTLEIAGHANIVPVGIGGRALRIIYDGPDGESVENPKTVVRINADGAYGSEFGRIEIAVRRRNTKNLVLLEMVGGVNSRIQDVRGVHWGVDCRGLVIRGKESVRVSGINFGCTQPLVILAGDNHKFEDLDLIAPTSSAAEDACCDRLEAIPILTGMPQAWTFAGQNAIHGGVQMMRIDAPPTASTGNALTLAGGFRYEQPLPGSVKPLIEFRFPGTAPGHALEQFIVSGAVRSSKRYGPFIGGDLSRVWKINAPPANFFELGRQLEL